MRNLACMTAMSTLMMRIRGGDHHMRMLMFCNNVQILLKQTTTTLRHEKAQKVKIRLMSGKSVTRLPKHIMVQHEGFQQAQIVSEIPSVYRSVFSAVQKDGTKDLRNVSEWKSCKVVEYNSSAKFALQTLHNNNI